MTIQSIRKSLLVSTAILTMAGVASAGGNTIAASAKSQNLATNSSITLASGLSVFNDFGTDVCATIMNRSEKTGLIQLTMTDFEATTTISTIARSKSSGLCAKDAESVELTCLGPAKCTFTWSVDKF